MSLFLTVLCPATSASVRESSKTMNNSDSLAKAPPRVRANYALTSALGRVPAFLRAPPLVVGALLQPCALERRPAGKV
jgi:hypothetical protein